MLSQFIKLKLYSIKIVNQKKFVFEVIIGRNEKRMLNRNLVSRGIMIIVIYLSLIFVFPLSGVEIKNIEKIKNLEQKIHRFENNFFQRHYAIHEDFSQVYIDLDSLIGEYIGLSENLKDSRFLEMAYAYLEKQKNLKILELFSQSENSDSTNLPFPNVLRQNYKLCQKVEMIKSTLVFSEVVNDSLENLWSEIQTSMADLFDSVAVNEPGALFFVQMMCPLDVTAIRKNNIGRQEVLLNYWMNDDQLYVFIVSPEMFVVNHWPLHTEELQNQVFELTAPFYQQQDLLDLKFDYLLANQLYLKLIEPIAGFVNQYNTLIISPDKNLIGFPFEVLVVDTAHTKKSHKNILYEQFRHMHFLINDHSVCYNYSTAALNPELILMRSRAGLKRRLLTMNKPILPNKNKLISNDRHTDLLNSISPTQYSAEEIKRVSRLLWRHHNLKGEQTTKNYLFENGSDYRWLYLALPGILNNTTPLFSGLFFSKSDPAAGVANQFLSAGEILSCNLRADMLTLSACKFDTAFKNHNSAAIVLPQAFLFAGVRSVVLSQWIVNSLSTSHFMSKFYWELKYKRQLNAVALREAKMNSLKETFKYLGEEISTAQPYFWAGFTLTGNPRVRPPSTSKIPPWGVVIIVYVLVIIFTIIIGRKTMANNKAR